MNITEYWTERGYIPCELQGSAEYIGEHMAAGDYERVLSELEGRHSDISLEVRTLYDAVLRLRPSLVVEAGCRSGESTIAFLAALEQIGGRIVSIDTDASVPSRVPEFVAKNPRWSFIHGDAAEVLGGRAIPRLGFVFVDTSHSYDDTRRELSAVLSRLTEDGESYWHDTLPPWRVGEAIAHHLHGSPFVSVEVGGSVAGMALVKRAASIPI